MDNKITSNSQNTQIADTAATQKVTMENSTKSTDMSQTANTISSQPKGTESSVDLSQFAEKIIDEQESIIGPIAREQATKVPGLTIDPGTKKVTLVGDKKAILENLVKQYELLFGRVSIEICREAIRGIVSGAPNDQVPQILL